MVKAGDVVLYTVQGKQYNALVLFAHSGQADHLGTDDQPLTHLAFIAPDRESAAAKSKPGYIPEIFIEYDVVHDSHQFSQEYCEKHNLFSPAQIAAARGNGEWTELVVTELPRASFVEYDSAKPPDATGVAAADSAPATEPAAAASVAED